MGLQGGMGAVSLLGWIGGWLLAPLFGMTIAVVAREEDGPLRVLFWTLFAAEIVLAVPLGRRVFLFTMFIGGLTVRLAHVWRRRVVLKRVAAVAVGVCGMYLASIVFLYIRAANYELDLDRQASLSVLLDKDTSSTKRGRLTRCRRCSRTTRLGGASSSTSSPNC